MESTIEQLQFCESILPSWWKVYNAVDFLLFIQIIAKLVLGVQNVFDFSNYKFLFNAKLVDSTPILWITVAKLVLGVPPILWINIAKLVEGI